MLDQQANYFFLIELFLAIQASLIAQQTFEAGQLAEVASQSF